MKTLKKCIALLLCLFLLPLPARAVQRQPRDIVQEALNYFRYHQTNARTDILRLLEELHEADPAEAAFWTDVFEYWFYAVEDMPKNETVIPEGLHDDSTLCIVVLGYHLQESGGMYMELIGRLELALQAAQQYPNAHILCTGGGTAKDAPGATEAWQMYYWLTNHGIDPARIHVEATSLHTIENARLGFAMLAENCPEVTQIALVTSDYHLTRSATLFYTQSLLSARVSGGTPIELAAFLGYEAGHEGFTEYPLDQVAHVARLVGFEYEYADAPSLSVLTDITLSKTVLSPDEDLSEITVSAHYDSGYTRDVTALCTTITEPLDDAKLLHIFRYEENGILCEAAAEYRLPPPETQAPTEPTEPTDPTIPATEPTETIPTPENRSPWGIIAVLCAAIVLAFVLRKRHFAKL